MVLEVQPPTKVPKIQVPMMVLEVQAPMTVPEVVLTNEAGITGTN